MMTRAAVQLRRFLASGVLAILLFTSLFGLSFHQVDAVSAPNLLNYQGRLLNANGVPISTSTASISFALYTAVTAGTCVWSNNSNTCASVVARTVTLTDGLFSENLGDTAAATPYAAISDSSFADNASLYLEVIVEGETLTPRKQLVAAPYAMNSDTLDGFDSTQAGGTTAAALVLDSSGNLQLTGNPSGSAIGNGSFYLNPATGDVAANDVLFGIAVTGTAKFSLDAEGDTIATGDFAVNGGDFTTGAATFNLLTTTATTLSFASAATTLNINNAAGVSTKTINIGGTSADSPDAVNISTEGTQADTIIIGNSHTSTLMTLTGGDDWSLTSGGLFTTAGNLNVNGGTVASTAALTLSSSGGDINLSPNGSGLVYVTAGDNFAVGSTTTTAAFSVTEATNVVRIGDGTADANNPTINFFSSNASTSGSLAYLDADAFDFTGGNFNVTGINTTGGSAQLFTDNTVTTATGLNVTANGLTSGIGLAVTRAAGGADFTGKILYIAQSNTATTSTGDVVVIENRSTSETAATGGTALLLVQTKVSNETDAAGGTTRGAQALFIDITEAGSTDDAVLIRSAGQLVFDIQSNGSVLSDGSYSSTGADYAEYFATNDNTLSYSLIACQDKNVGNAVERCSPAATEIVGIVSPTPGFIGNMPNKRDAANTIIVGLNGQIDTLVDDSGGVIRIGDPITTSSTTAGYGAKAIGAGRIVGYALEPLAASTGTIRVLVQPQWFGGTEAVSAPTAELSSAEVIAANPVVTPNNSISGLTNTSLLNVDGSLNMNGGRILAISSLQGLGDNWHLAENGDFTTHGQFIGLVNGYSGAPVATYAAMSRQQQIQLSGTSTLQNGIARILFASVDPQFADIISNTSPYRIIATPSGLTGQIYVSERDLTGFTIRDVNNSNGVEVDWLVMAYHKDFAPIGEVTTPRPDEPVVASSSLSPVIEPSSDIVAPVTDAVIAESPAEPVTTAEEPVIITEPVVDAPIIAESVTIPDSVVTSDPVVESTPAESAPVLDAPVAP